MFLQVGKLCGLVFVDCSRGDSRPELDHLGKLFARQLDRGALRFNGVQAFGQLQLPLADMGDLLIPRLHCRLARVRGGGVVLQRFPLLFQLQKRVPNLV